MPGTGIPTVPDIVCIATIASAFITLPGSALGLVPSDGETEAAARRTDPTAIAVVPVASFALCAYLVLG